MTDDEKTVQEVTKAVVAAVFSVREVDYVTAPPALADACAEVLHQMCCDSDVSKEDAYKWLIEVCQERLQKAAA